MTSVKAAVINEDGEMYEYAWIYEHWGLVPVKDHRQCI